MYVHNKVGFWSYLHITGEVWCTHTYCRNQNKSTPRGGRDYHSVPIPQLPAAAVNQVVVIFASGRNRW